MCFFAFFRVIFVIFMFYYADIRSWWEVPCVSHFCKIFSKPFKLPEYEIEVCVCVCVRESVCVC